MKFQQAFSAVRRARRFGYNLESAQWFLSHVNPMVREATKVLENRDSPAQGFNAAARARCRRDWIAVLRRSRYGREGYRRYIREIGSWWIQ